LITGTSCKDKGSSDAPTPIIALVNEEPITLKDIEEEKNISFFMQTLQTLPPNKVSDINKNMLSKIIDKKILLQEARKKNIFVSNEELENEISRIKNDFPQNTFSQYFKENAISYSVWKNKLQEVMTIDKLLNSVTEKEPVITDEEIYIYYKTHQDDFKNINKVLLRQILVNDAKTAEEVRKRLNDGEKFEKLAEEYSVGYEKKNGGLLPLLSKDELPPQLEDVFKLQVGSIYGPIKTEYGYHVVRLEKKITKKKVELNEARESIKTILKREKINEALKEYLTTIRKNANIKILNLELLNPAKS